MRIKLFPRDTTACGSNRMIWPAEALRADDIEICMPGDSVDLNEPNCDVVVWQRPSGRHFAENIELFQERGLKVVVELDDDYCTIPTDNIARAQYDPRHDSDDNWNWLSMACAKADRVVAPTKALVEKYGHGQGVLVPNFVPERYLKHRVEENDPLLVGWTGNLEVHASDLGVVGAGVAIALSATGAHFRFVGASSQTEKVQRELRLDRLPSATGWVELEDYPALLSDLDVGLVPLASNVFNESKSYLKGLEYSALGIPFVASSTQPYRELAAKGAGLVVGGRKDWGRHLKRLITDDAFRRDQAESGYEVAKANTVEGNAWRFLEAWGSW